MGEINIVVKSKAPIAKVYAMAQSAYEFVDSMPNIKEIIVLEKSSDLKFSKAEWVLDVPLPAKYGRLSWIKEVEWNDNDMRCDIRLSPDCAGSIVKRLNGKWQFEQRPDCSRMNMSMDFRVSHPMVTPFVHNIFVGLMERNLANLLRAIKDKTERDLKIA